MIRVVHWSALTWAEYGGIMAGLLVLARREVVAERRRRRRVLRSMTEHPSSQ
jgi:hypothetical protein